MKKIRRRLSQNEITIMRLDGVFAGITQYLKEKGMIEDCQAWFKTKLEGGDDNDGLQRNEEVRKDADEREDGKDGGCCGEGACCKKGKEEVEIKAVDYRCPYCGYNFVNNPGSILISKDGKFFCSRCSNPLQLLQR